MKAVRLHEHGKPPVAEEVPEPAVTSPLDVLVKVGGAGLCRTDLDLIEDRWVGMTGTCLPYTLGHESAGWVYDIGSGVTNVAPGDAVILHPLVNCGLCRACRSGNDRHCERARTPGIDSDGGMAELVLTNAMAVVKLPHTLDPMSIAVFADAGLAAYQAVKSALSVVPPGGCVVVLGGDALAQIGLQCATALSPHETVIVDHSDWGKRSGSAAPATAEAERQRINAVLDLTGGRGAHLVLDFLGTDESGAAALALLRRAGSYFVTGYGAGIRLPTNEILQAHLVGRLVGSHQDLDELMGLVAAGKVRTTTSVYRLDGVSDAIANLKAGQITDWVVLSPDLE
ncbi:NAD(P)-dependent alcohol dehydrogenase [Saccharopolyspora rhizosphaerae]|uniref:alcohol dehydrogenase n=1 Tax=Saccharopolyspora rhizosphaerae TaxID=2492662 RepID=A0A426JX66_9PSEU|nr:alcohol dehydrogenase catalytic domain-containing protein [Saccharopolyspora rhizosphaerae]RRO17661.1 NAD(P)-dependent alcohol dehydrogenase [Saccharopolyspora rhizosphaerae]